MTAGFPPPPEPLGDGVTFTSDTGEDAPPPVLAKVTSVYEVRLSDRARDLHGFDRDRGLERATAGSGTLPAVDAVRVDIGHAWHFNQAEESALRTLALSAPHVQVLGTHAFGVRTAADIIRRAALAEVEADRQYREQAAESWPLPPNRRVDGEPARAISPETTALLLEQARNPEKRPHNPPRENTT